MPQRSTFTSSVGGTEMKASSPPSAEDNNSPYSSQSPSRNHAGPSNPQSRSPLSSASSVVPSEPTVDLSAWSPRSRNITLPTLLITSSRPNRTKRYSPGQQLITEWSKRAPFCSSGGCQQMVLHTQGRNNLLVTKDPNPPKTFPQLSSILHTHLLAVHYPITINPLHSLCTVNRNLLFLGEVQKILKADTHSTISLTRSAFQTRESTELALKMSNFDLILSSEDETGTQCIPDITPVQPGTHDSELPSSLLSLPSPVYPITSAQTQFSSSPPGRALSPNHPNTVEPMSVLTVLPDNNTSKPLGYNNNSGDTVLPAQISHHPQHKQNKQTTLPARRSQRILEKRSMLGPDQNGKKRNKTQVSMIHFGKDTHQTPLDVSKTLQILQATGLTINKQIEDLIDEAVKQDQLMEKDEHSAPTTPLHDPIPPLPFQEQTCSSDFLGPNDHVTDIVAA